MKELIKYSELLYHYLPLFTKKQQKYLSMYFFNDMTYQEISNECHVSPVAVFDLIKRCKKQLLSYESKLNLHKINIERLEYYQKIKDKKIKEELLKIDNIYK